ncbi:unnamed protein product [Cochlearia groenlandica]
MSMLDSFFNKGFKASKCKTLLKLTIPRIKLIRNRREAHIKQMRREIAKLLENGQEATARIRVEHIIREEKMMSAQEILELFCELIAVRLPIIESQRECPIDLKEAISSVCFAAPRCSDLTELQQVQVLFVSKYGKEFVAAASELKPDSGVNRKLVELLSVRAPSPETKLKLLKEIAEEHELDWDPASTETDLFKSHEDLLDGPKQFGGGSKVPLPEEQDEGPRLTSLSEPKEKSDSDSEYDMLDFPDVPNALLRPNHGATPESAPEAAKSSKYDHAGDKKPASKKDEHPSKASSNVVEDQKPSPIVMESFEKNDYSPSSVVGVVEPSSTKASGPSRDSPKKISDGDLQDVLMAAHAAADSAERAAAAARSAASLAQLKIAELTKKSSDESLESLSENPFHTSSVENSHFDHQNSFSSSCEDLTEPQKAESSSLFNIEQDNHKPQQRLDSMENPEFDHQDSSVRSYGDLTPQRDRQQMRLPSMEDDPYYSYPNLFTPQNPDRSSDNTKPAHDS